MRVVGEVTRDPFWSLEIFKCRVHSAMWRCSSQVWGYASSLPDTPSPEQALRIPKGAYFQFQPFLCQSSAEVSFSVRTRLGQRWEGRGWPCVYTEDFSWPLTDVTQQVGSQRSIHFLYGKCMPPALEEQVHRVTQAYRACLGSAC